MIREMIKKEVVKRKNIKREPVKKSSVVKTDAKGSMIMREEPKELQIYKHFKGNLYQIITIAIHSETGEKLVIYRPLYNGASNYARPLEMFMSEVDHEKYPGVTQKYRFELQVGGVVSGIAAASETPSFEKSVPAEETAGEEEAASADEVVSEEEIIPAAEESDNIEAPVVESTEETEEVLQLDPKLEKFLDAGSYGEKLECFYDMRRTATKEMLSYVAMSLDIELSKEDLDEQYSEILYCLRTLEKYECNRLR